MDGSHERPAMIRVRMLIFEPDAKLMRSWNRRETMLGGAASLALAGCSRETNSIRTIRAITFPGAYNLLIWAAQENGLLEAEALRVEREQTTTSMYLVENLVAGAFDIAASSIDNVVAYNEGQGEIALDRSADMIVVAGILPNAVLPLIVQPEIESIVALEGRALAVDAVSTGFSFVLRKILEAGGLKPGAYELVSVGSARDRFEALTQGRYAGAILTPPFDDMAVGAGLKRLADSRIALADYQATCFVTTRRWASENEGPLIGFLRAMIRALAWVDDPANEDAARGILIENISSMDDGAAGRALGDIRKTVSLDLNMKGVETVLALRRQYGEPLKSLGAPEAYIDQSYLEAARTGLR